MARHKRRSELRKNESQQLLAEVQATHGQITELLLHLKPKDR